MQVRRMELEQTAARAGMVATPTVLSILGVFTYRASVEQEYGFERRRGFGAYGNNTEELLRSADGALSPKVQGDTASSSPIDRRCASRLARASKPSL